MSQAPQLDQQLDTLAQWIAASDHLVAFTGAGISTDSGIPDYRGPDGVWTRRDKGLPAPQWKTPIDRVRPNASHLALAELDRLGKLKFLISQNIDNLHRASGVRPEILAELHGNNQLLRCAGCDALFDKGAIGWDDRRWGPAYRNRRPAPGHPPCPDCGGRLVDSVVNFGDPMPPKEMLLADRNARRADVMLVLGSSLVVEPAASLVGVAVRNAAKLVLVNRGETPYDRVATMRLWVGIADVLPKAVERVKTLRGKE